MFEARKESRYPFYLWTGFLSILIVLGVSAAAAAFIRGHEILEISKAIPWSLLISTYVFFVVSSTGLCIVSSVGDVFRVKRYERISRTGVYLAIVTIVAGFLAILLHLGHAERLIIYTVFTPNLSSAIWWMGFFYSFYFFFIVIEYWFLARYDMVKMQKVSTGLKASFYKVLTLGSTDESEDSLRRDIRRAQIIGALALVAGVSAHNTLGAVFGHVEARALWYGAYYPVYFLLSAVFSGLAWLIFAVILTYKATKKSIDSELQKLISELGRILAFVLALGLLFTAWKVVSGAYSAEKLESILLLLKGPFSLNFWVFEILLGTLIPVFILLHPRTGRTISGIFTASLLVLIGIFVMRYDFVIAGQILPLLRGGLPSYAPTLFESLIAIGIIALCAFLYTLGVKYFPLLKNEK
ncbi:polysulfide reductase NrfD [Candidatus Woesearchaeota archaeon]|nr:polysulfide reductase NrfD [Candidatus Woesearchaeota archaeon]